MGGSEIQAQLKKGVLWGLLWDTLLYQQYFCIRERELKHDFEFAISILLK